MDLICEGEVATFDAAPLGASIANFLGVEESQVAIAISAASVLAVVEVVGSEEGTTLSYAALSSLSAGQASDIFGVTITTILVFSPQPVPADPAEENLAQVVEEGVAAGLAIGAIVAGCAVLLLMWCGVIRCRRRQRFKRMEAGLSGGGVALEDRSGGPTSPATKSGKKAGPGQRRDSRSGPQQRGRQASRLAPPPIRTNSSVAENV